MSRKYGLKQLPLRRDSFLRLHPRDDGYWLLVVLSPLATVGGFAALLVVGLWNTFIGLPSFLTLSILFASLGLLYAVSTLALPFGLYRDINHVSTLDTDWNPPRTAFVGLGIVSVLMPFFADAVALTYLFFRVNHTELGPKQGVSGVGKRILPLR